MIKSLAAAAIGTLLSAVLLAAPPPAYAFNPGNPPDPGLNPGGADAGPQLAQNSDRGGKQRAREQRSGRKDYRPNQYRANQYRNQQFRPDQQLRPDRQAPDRQAPERSGPERNGPERNGPERGAPERQFKPQQLQPQQNRPQQLQPAPQRGERGPSVLYPRDEGDRRALQQLMRHDRARRAVEQGTIRPLEEIRDTVQRQFGGRIVGLELYENPNRGVAGWVYDVRVLTQEGNVMAVEMDARSGRVMSVRGQR